MPIIMNLIRKTAIAILALAPLLSFAQTASPQAAPLSGLKQMPPIPSSSALLQSALNDFNTCIANTLSAAAATQSQPMTPAAVTSQCATQQAKLKQMLPPAANNAGAADAQQYVAKVMASQASMKSTANP